MLDVLQTILWSLTYVIIVFNGIRYRRERPLLMPLLAGSLNFAWEINALIMSRGLWGHVVWITLDIVILTLNVCNLRKIKSRILYCIVTIASIVALWIIFRLPNMEGMLISVFTIDFIMALEYAVVAKYISGRGKVMIASTKLLGDFSAYLYYMKYMKFVAVIGVFVLILNFYYLNNCLKEASRDRNNDNQIAEK